MSEIDELCFHTRLQDTCPDMVRELRSLIRRDVEERDGQILFPSKYRIFSTSIPRFKDLPDLFNLYKMKYIDLDMQDDLERSEVLNWCRTAEPVYPLKTTADGNCLLHAVSLAMWGIEDTEMFLRRLLYLNIVTDPTGAFKKRWLFHQRNNSDLLRADVRLNTIEVCEEWEMVIKATDDLTQSQTADLPYTALESIHLYVSANMLKRPIIVLADSMARNVFGQTMQDNQIGGIYLPLEWKPEQCDKNPIVIGYNMNHFCPLVLKEKSKHRHSDELFMALPIVTKQLNSLPAHFLLPNEESGYYSIIRMYLNMTEVLHNMTPVPAVQLHTVPLKNDVNVIEANKRDCLSKWRRLNGEFEPQPMNQPQPKPFHFTANAGNRIPSAKDDTKTKAKHNVMPAEHVKRKHCVTVGCELFADPAMQNLCSKCFKEFTVLYAKQEDVARHVAGIPPVMPGLNTAVNPNLGHGQYPVTERQTSYHDLSMIGEDCQTGCGFKCSVGTYPYCHECYPKYVQQGGAGQQPPANQMPELSLMPDKCQNPVCAYKCSKATYPFCHTCFQTLNQNPNTEPTAPPPSVPTTLVDVRNTVNQPGLIRNAPQPTAPNMGVPVFNGNQPSTQNAPMEFRFSSGTLNKECMAAGCDKLAIRGNNGFCNDCYEQAMFSGTPVMQCSSPGTTERAQCSTPGCNEELTPGTNHCTQCFLRGDKTPSRQPSLTGLTSLNIQPSLKMLNHPQKAQNAFPSIPVENEEPHPYQPNQEQLVVNLQQEEQIALQKKMICSKPGCAGMRGINEEGLCDNCFLYEPQRSGEIKERHASSLENSAPYASCNLPPLSSAEMMKLNPIVKSSRDKVNCASPTCKTMIYPPRKLCDECASVLQKHQASKSMEFNLKSVGENGVKCLTEGCQFYGLPETFGYCSSCHKSHVSLNHHTLPIAQKSSLSSNTAPLVYRQTDTKTPTAPLVGKLCITPRCTRYGDPRQADRCSQHYELEIMATPHMSPESLQEQQNIIALQQQGYRISSDKYNVAGSNYPPTTQGLGQTRSRTRSTGEDRLKTRNNSETTSTFDDVYSKLFSSKKTSRHCKNKNQGCPNFENPARDGYCNTCYNQYRLVRN